MTRPPIHPGAILADELAELQVSPTELARQIDVPANRISQIIQGKRSITGDTAVRLSHWFKTSAQFCGDCAANGCAAGSARRRRPCDNGNRRTKRSPPAAAMASAMSSTRFPAPSILAQSV
jgi:addiction module HigA family antidote